MTGNKDEIRVFHVDPSNSIGVTVAQQITDELAKGIGSEWAYGDKLPSRKELAERFGTSTATISKAVKQLSDDKRVQTIPGKGVYVVDPESNVRVQQDAASGTSVALVGAYVPFSPQISRLGLDHVSRVSIIDGVWAAAGDMGTHLVLCPEMRNGVDIEQLKATGTNGVIVLGGMPLEQLIKLRSAGMPAIHANASVGAAPLNYVDYDLPGVMVQAADQLLDAGHERVGVITSWTSIEKAEAQRRSVWIDRFLRRGVVYDFYDYYQPFDASMNSTSMPEYRRRIRDLTLTETKRLLSLPQPPTALFCRESSLVGHVTQVLEEFGLRVPEDISVIAMTEDQWADRYSSFEFPHAQLGKMLMKHLSKTIVNPRYFVQGLIEVPYTDNGSVANLNA